MHSASNMRPAQQQILWSLVMRRLACRDQRLPQCAATTFDAHHIEFHPPQSPTYLPHSRNDVLDMFDCERVARL